MIQLGALLLKQKRFTEAEPLLRQSFTTREKIEPDKWTTFNTGSVLGEALLGQKRYTEAAPLLVQGYEGMKMREDKIPPAYRRIRISESLERLVRLYAASGQKEQSDHWRRKLQKAKAEQEKSVGSLR